MSTVTFQHLSRTIKRQASHRQVPVPEKLEVLIWAANAVPPEYRPPPRWFTRALFQAMIERMGRRPHPRGLGRAIHRDDAFSRRVLDEDYNFARDACEVVSAIVSMGRKSGREGSVFLDLIGPNQLLKIEVNDKGESQIVHGPIVEALLGTDIRRIRECPICSDFFWAGRIDQSCCSTQCAHILRTRRWRENYLERYKLQRDKRTTPVEHIPSSADQQRKTPSKARASGVR